MPRGPATVDVLRKERTSGGREPTVRGAHTDINRLTTLAAQAAAAKKAEDIVILDVGDILAVTERFVICSGTNVRQVRTIVDEVMKQLRDEAGCKPRSIEGLDDASWVLLDYGDFVVHVFLSETRAYYDLERLWADAPSQTIEPVAAVS